MGEISCPECGNRNTTRVYTNIGEDAVLLVYVCEEGGCRTEYEVSYGDPIVEITT